MTNVMNIATEDYVSFEVAKLLKEKGFNEKVICYYDDGGSLNLNKFIEFQCCNEGYGSGVFAAPILQIAMKWLREVHHLTIDVFHFMDWRVTIKAIPDDYFKADYSYPELKPTNTYEEACEAAIKYCLENLI